MTITIENLNSQVKDIKVGS